MVQRGFVYHKKESTSAQGGEHVLRGRGGGGGRWHLTTEKQWLLRKLFIQRALKRGSMDGSTK